MADTGCTSCPTTITLFDHTKSTTFNGSNFATTIPYGQGRVSGEIVQDTVSMAGFTVPSQTFCTLIVDRFVVMSNQVYSFVSSGCNHISPGCYICPSIRSDWARILRSQCYEVNALLAIFDLRWPAYITRIRLPAHPRKRQPSSDRHGVRRHLHTRRHQLLVIQWQH